MAEAVCINILTRMKEFGRGPLTITAKVTQPPLCDRPLVTGYFDGVEQKGLCGFGMVIKVNINHCFNLRMVVGFGTNTKAKLVALCGILYFSHYKQLYLCQILGDSKHG